MRWKLLILFKLIFGVDIFNIDVEQIKADITDGSPFLKSHKFVSDWSISRTWYEENVFVYGHAHYVNNPSKTFSMIEPGGFRGGCSEKLRVPVKETIGNYSPKCLVAVNAGFFNTTDGACHGHLVTDSKIIQTTESMNAALGITSNGSIVTGYLPSKIVRKSNFINLVNGVIWIVRNGKNYVEEALQRESNKTQETGSLHYFVEVQSARTAIGHDGQGRLVLVEIEGQTGSRGLNLIDFSNFLIEKFNVTNAINLDGGGSASLVMNGTETNYPSDHCTSDPQWRCERSVSTVACIHAPKCSDTCTDNGHSCSAEGKCICSSPVWRGENCSELFCGFFNCSKNGICSPKTFECNCAAGWSGPDCQYPCHSRRFWGQNCLQICQCRHRNATCDRVSGECKCPAGFGGPLCSVQCAPGYYGSNCLHECPAQCRVANTTCDRETGTCFSQSETSKLIPNDEKYEQKLKLGVTIFITCYILYIVCLAAHFTYRIIYFYFSYRYTVL